jgi:hypothetical protein
MTPYLSFPLISGRMSADPSRSRSRLIDITEQLKGGSTAGLRKCVTSLRAAHRNERNGGAS